MIKPPLAPERYDRLNEQEFRRLIEQELEQINAAAGKYTVTTPPVTPVRTFDANSATTADVAAVLATLIADLKRKGTLV